MRVPVAGPAGEMGGGSKGDLKKARGSAGLASTILRGRGLRRYVTVLDSVPPELVRRLMRLAVAAAAGLLEPQHRAGRHQPRLHAVHLLGLGRARVDDRTRQRRPRAAVEAPGALLVVGRACG